jgi:hypothetical protein
MLKTPTKVVGKRKPSKASVKNSYTSPREIELQEKRNQALDLRRHGHNYEAIAKAMGCSISSAHGYVVEALKAIPRENAELYRTMLLERHEQMMASIYSDAAGGDLGKQKAFLDLSRELAKLMGLYPDAKQGVGVSVTTGDGNGKTTAIEVTFVEPVARDDDED